MNIILSSYLTGKQDPQRGVKVQPDNFEYIKTWYKSAQALDLEAIIIHDELSDEFIDKYSTPKINFFKTRLGRYSTNDSRFFVYLDILMSGSFEYVLMTDISDVTFVRNPFHFIDEAGFDLYFGNDMGFMGESEWLIGKSKVIYGMVNYPEKKILNAGAIGGKYEAVKEFLELATKEIKQFGHIDNCNMLAVNKVVYDNYTDIDFYYGSPFTSEFKKNEKPEETKAYIIHK